MIITNVTGSYFLKQNDTATKMRLLVTEADGITPVDLVSAIRLEVVIGVPEGRVLVKTPTILEEPGQLEFGLDDGDLLPTGDDRLEVHVFYAPNMKRVAPSKGYYKLRIQEPIDTLEANVTTFTLDYFIGEVNRLTGNIPALADQARELISELETNVPLATELVNNIGSIAQQAQTASTQATNAYSTFQNIIPTTQTATAEAQAAAISANAASSSANINATSALNAADSANAAAFLATNAGNAAQLAAGIANGTVASLEDLQDDLIGYASTIVDFDMATTYMKFQSVRFNGSTYRAKVETQGNALPVAPDVENAWWTLVAQRGVDGSGAVSSVNGIQPATNGEVTLTPSILGATPVSHLNNSDLKHIELLDTLPSDYTDRGIVFRRTQVGPSAPERPDYNVEFANHVATNASKTVKGHVQIGDGLEVADGVVSSNFYYDNSTNLDAPPNAFGIGTTINVPNTVSSNPLQVSLSDTFYGIMGYSPSSKIIFRFAINTHKGTTMAQQEVVISTNANGSVKEVARMRREVTSASPNVWLPWTVSMSVYSTSGNPNGTVSGMKGFLTLDILSGILYYKSTGTTTSTTNTGWVPIGGTA